MAIYDFNQPAKNWLADNLENFGKLLEKGDDPSVLLTLHGGIVVEVRLNKLPGTFVRESVSVTASAGPAAQSVHENYECPHCGAVGEHEQDDCPTIDAAPGKEG